MAKGLTDQLDKILLGVAVVALIASTAWVVMGLGKPLPNIDDVTRVVKKQAEEVTMDPFMDLLDEIDVVYASNEGLNFDVLVSEPRVPSQNTNQIFYLIPQDAEICPFTGEKQPDLDERDSDLDGMKDVYELKYGLNPAVNDLHLDFDEDGFSNGEEFDAGTAPNDKEVHPPLIVKVRVDKAANKPYPFEFQGVTKMSEDDLVFSLKLKTSRSYFLRVGQAEEGWKPVRYEYIKAPEAGSPDKSTLELESVKTGERITLQINKRGGSAERWIARLVLLTDSKWKQRVEKGTEFELLGTKYIVLRLNGRGAQLKEIESGEEFTIKMMTEDEDAIRRGERTPEMMGSEGFGSDQFGSPSQKSLRSQGFPRK